MQIPPDYSARPIMNIEAYRGRNDPESVKAVSREMEALFVNEMLKAMRETVGSADKGSLGGDTYMSMFDMELSRLFAQRGLGVQEALSRSISASQDKQADSGTETKNASDTDNAKLKSMGSPLPDIRHPRVTSDYGPRTDPFTEREQFHHGLDLAAPAGTLIHAVQSGTVVFSGTQQGYGNVVIIDHDDGYTTKYAHNQKNLVQVGDRVETGSVLAQVGSTGRSTGPHLHFEVQYRGRETDPETLLVMG